MERAYRMPRNLASREARHGTPWHAMGALKPTAHPLGAAANCFLLPLSYDHATGAEPRGTPKRAYRDH
eukprot:5142450-Prymnesium_polylepis.1